MSEKLQKVLARAGHGSRREIESIIEAGRVSVDGKIAKLGDRVEITPGLKIRIDGHLISVRESAEQICRVLAYYKPGIDTETKLTTMTWRVKEDG